jgi:hypothetical protein
MAADANNVTDPTWTCFIDGTEIPSKSFKFPENNWPLCEQSQLDSEPHTLTIQVKSAGQPFYLDSLVYTPSPDALFPSAVLIYSDDDPAVSYSVGWTEEAGEQVTQTAGAQVTLSFHGALYFFLPSDENQLILINDQAPPSPCSPIYRTNSPLMRLSRTTQSMAAHR